MICQTPLTQAKVKYILSPINDMQFSDRIRIENGLFHLYGPYGWTWSVRPIYCRKKNTHDYICRPREMNSERLWSRAWKCCPRPGPRSQFSLYGPPSRQITYIYHIYYVCYRHRFFFGTTLLILTALIFFIFIIWLYLTRIKYQIHEQSKMDVDRGLDFIKLINNLSR